MPSLSNRHEDVLLPSTSPTHRTTALPSKSSVGIQGSTHYEVVRAATSVLCEQMLRQRIDLDKRESEEVRIRMRPLGRLEIVWRESQVYVNGSTTSFGASSDGLGIGASIVGEERAQRLFAKALRDGYVLCQLMNKLRPGSIPQFDPHEDGIRRRSNLTKFLASCSANGLPPQDLFLPNDLVEGSSHSLARVARTIITLVKWAEGSAPTNPPSLPGGGPANPEQLPTFRPLRLRSRPEHLHVTTGAVVSPSVPPLERFARVAASDLPPPRPPRSPRRPPTPKPDTVDAGGPLSPPFTDGAITHSTRDQPISTSIKNQSTSPSIKDRSIPPLIKNRPTRELPSMNESTALSTKSISASTNEIYPSIMNRSTTNQSRVLPRSLPSHRTNNESRMPLPHANYATSETPPTKNMSTPPLSEKQPISSPRTKEALQLQKNSPVDEPVPKIAHPPRMTWWHRVCQAFARLTGRSRHQKIPKYLQTDSDHLDTPGHTFVGATFSKSFDCRVCVKSMKRGAVRCSRCSLVAHAKCAARAPVGCYF